jgi:hypothetical protein
VEKVVKVRLKKRDPKLAASNQTRQVIGGLLDGMPGF